MRMTFPGLIPASTYSLQLRAVDGKNTMSEWSRIFTMVTESDTQPPPVPSTPILSSRLGTITITWDGLGSLGEPMPYDFVHCEVHTSTTSGFIPSVATLVSTIDAAAGTVVADLIYNTVYYFRLISVDTWGNKSEPSAEASETVTPLVDTDAINLILDGTQIAGQTITAAQLADGSVDASKILAGTVNQTFTSTTAPTGMMFKVNDVWINTTTVPPDNLPGNVMNIWTGSAWVVMEPAAIKKAQDTADMAVSMPGGNTMYFQIAQPTGGTYVVGDIWYDTDDGNKPYRYTGTIWSSSAFGSGAIASGAIIAGKITAGTITAADIAANTITAAKISAGAIGATELAANSVIAGKIAANAITANEIQALSISADKIQANAITADKIDAGAITAVKLDAYAIDGKTITGVTINSATFKTVTYSSRIEVGNTGISDPADEIRMFNGSTVVSMRNPSDKPGRLRFSLFNGGIIDVLETTDGHRGFMGGSTLLKFLIGTPHLQVRDSTDSYAGGITVQDATVYGSLYVGGSMSARYLVQAGSFSVGNVPAGGPAATGSVGYPLGYFGVTPSVTMSSTSGRMTCAVTNVYTNYWTYAIDNWSNAGSGSATIRWIAVAQS